MKKMKNNKKRGQSSVEYILIIAAVVGIIFMFGGKFKTGVQGTTDQLTKGMGDKVGDLMK